ncbi:hypothetical protein [Myroides sp. WP-1]|uniref:hypothetical protein n=1 Tax=Myroides sp. WP-1 TaxID=2759944 RepID=UPI0015FCCE07|nr:hypothetical protein [Myroides sp. WP-1]MBB1139012.1 hypothetical protein [Myroides sp. WP-1]
MKKELFKFITLSVALFSTIILVQSCAVSGLSKKSMNFQEETAQNGLLIGSITFPKEKAKFNGYLIGVTSKDTDKKIARKKSTVIHISPEQIWKMKHKGELDNGLTYLFTLERPEGKYEISSLGLFTNSGFPALQRTDYLDGFSIPFDVKKGEITYVGNIIVNEHSKVKDIRVLYENNYEKDINALKTLQPAVDWNKAINDTSRKIEYDNTKVKR